MNIGWKMKSAIFREIDRFSLHGLLYLLQKHVTGRAKVSIRSISENWQTHAANLAPLGRGRIVEFGAGKSLSQNIYLSKQVGSQVLVDIFPMLDMDLFNEAARQISLLDPEIPYRPCSTPQDIEKAYGIAYRAPVDMSRSGFADDSFDGCISTNTLEHIPREAILAIFTELRRVIRPGGLISAIIDYSDHYSHTDRSLHPLNYLTFTEAGFRRHNHAVHYQNRLRHFDYLDIFRSLNYEILEQVPSDFASIPEGISDEFDRNEPSLAALRGMFLLRVAK